MRKARPVTLTPAEVRFRLDQWVEHNMVIVERHGPEWVVVCPACGRAKLAVHVGRKAFQCWSGHCRFRGWRPVVLVAAALGVNHLRAGEIIAASGMGVDLGPVSPLAQQEYHRSPLHLPKASLPYVDWTLHQDARDYLHQRGAPDEHIRLAGAGSIVDSGRSTKADRVLRGRIIFPAWSLAGRMVWWVARAVGDHKIKTINMPRSCRDPERHGRYCVCFHDEWGLPPVPEAAAADEAVLGLHLVEPGHPVIVVEGPIDQVVCGPSFVSVQRSWISPQQALQIAATGASEAVILFDGDRAGADGMRRSLPILRAALPTRGTTCPTGADPGSLGRADALALALAAPHGGIQQLSCDRYKPIARTTAPAPFVGPLTRTS